MRYRLFDCAHERKDRMRLPVALISALALVALPAAANAAQCKDAKGKFIKCPPAAAATVAPKSISKTVTKATTTTTASKSAVRCKDAKGKFVKCPPAPAATIAASTTSKTATKATTTSKSSGKMAGRCRNAKGQFAKCGTPGTRPA
jgi:nitrous oxidase accessory protein NosD